MKQNQKGITIVALVVTIVVLLILAAITIGSLKSDNGIIKEANTAKKAVEMQALEEQIEMAIIKAEQKHRNPTLEQVIEEIEKIEHVTKVDKETGEIENDLGDPIKGKLDDYIKKGNTEENTTGNNTTGGEITKPDEAKVQITKNPSNIETIEKNKDIKFEIEAEGEGSKTYQWYQNNTNTNNGGTEIRGETNPTYTIPASEVTTALNETYYYCTVTLKNGTATDTKASLPAKLNVVEKAKITKQPEEIRVIAGKTNVNFEVVATGEGTLTYKWYKNLNNTTTGGTEVGTGTTYNIATANVTNTLSGNYYYCMVTQKYGSSTATVTSNAVNLFVVSPVTITKQPISANVKEGTVVTFSITATGTGITGYQWYQNSTSGNSGGTAISGATSATYTIPAGSVTTALSGKYYYCVVSQTYGSSNTTVASNGVPLIVTQKTVEDYKNSGGVLSETDPTTIKDTNGNKVVVPEGFKIAEDSANDVTGGVVIEDVSHGDTTAGSQFVWIPVGTVKYSGGTKTINLDRYTFADDGTPAAYGDKAINVYFQELSISSSGNATAKDIEAFKTSVPKNGGYYIGRYEARTPIQRTSSSTSTLDIVTTRPNDYVYNYVTQVNAATQSRAMYNGSTTSFTSDLMNSYAWDTAIVFLQEFDNRNNKSTVYSWQSSLNKTFAIKGTNNLSAPQQDKICNVWDMASNDWEWTTETSIDPYNLNKACVYIDGSYYGSYNFASNR